MLRELVGMRNRRISRRSPDRINMRGGGSENMCEGRKKKKKMKGSGTTETGRSLKDDSTQ